MGKPNILLLMADVHRWDALGCSGGWLETPNLDRIAHEGIRFANCVANTPVCIPTRLTMATGHYPHNTGIWMNCHYTLSPETPTWMQAVREAGYRTSLFGKTHLTPHYTGGLGREQVPARFDDAAPDLRDREPFIHAYGLDDVNEAAGPMALTGIHCHLTERWQKKGVWEAYKKDLYDLYHPGSSTKLHDTHPTTLDLEDYPDVYVAQQAKEYLETYDRSDPWFCWVSFAASHPPWDVPEPYFSRYDPEDMPDPLLPPTSEKNRPQGRFDRLIELVETG